MKFLEKTQLKSFIPRVSDCCCCDSLIVHAFLSDWGFTDRQLAIIEHLLYGYISVPTGQTTDVLHVPGDGLAGGEDVACADVVELPALEVLVAEPVLLTSPFT